MVSKRRKQEKAPQSCKECEHWTEVRNKLRVNTVLTSVIIVMSHDLLPLRSHDILRCVRHIPV
jgi:hypothetical protein